MYFDHQNKVVMLEKPAGQTGNANLVKSDAYLILCGIQLSSLKTFSWKKPLNIASPLP